MILKLTAKNCRISENTRRYIDQHIHKVAQALPNMQEDMVVLTLMVRKNIDKYHPQRNHSSNKAYANKKPALAYFNGSISFRLEKKWLYVHFKGQTIDECVGYSFGVIFRELKKFKELHFSSESKYPDRSSIRKELYE